MRYRIPKTSGTTLLGRLFRNPVAAAERSGNRMKCAVEGEAMESSHSPKAIHDAVRRIESQREVLRHHLKWWSDIEDGLDDVDAMPPPEQE